MPILEGIRIQNYRVLKDITLGRTPSGPYAAPLNPLTAVIGKNGVGKSSLFDAFGFLADCLKLGVEEACDQRGRGGFDRILSQGSDGPIAFEVCYREEPQAPLIIYRASIQRDKGSRPFVNDESLFQILDAWRILLIFGASGWYGCGVGKGSRKGNTFPMRRMLGLNWSWSTDTLFGGWKG